MISNIFQAEVLGCEGKVEEAQGVMKLCEQLREEREQLNVSTITLSFFSEVVNFCVVEIFVSLAS